MKAYSKPTIEFIELKPEERLACESGGCSGCCSGGGGTKSFGWWCGYSYPWGWCWKPKYFVLWC